MSTAFIMWLVIFGALLIASFWMGAYYLSEWKSDFKHLVEATVKLEKATEISSREASELAGYKIGAKINLLVWIVSFFFTFLSLGGVFWVLATKL